MGKRTRAELACVALTSGACGASFEVAESELSVEACALRRQHPWILTAHNANERIYAPDKQQQQQQLAPDESNIMPHSNAV
jgi:hypothetical protein